MYKLRRKFYKNIEGGGCVVEKMVACVTVLYFLHLIDWSSFDKTVCGIALLDSDENVIFGKVPSVDECKSYNLPSLLNVQYVWRI